MLTLNWGFVFTIINLLVLYVLLKKFLFRPVLNIMEERDRLVRRQLDSAQDKEAEARELLARRQTALAGTEGEAHAIIEKAKATARDESEAILKDTGEEVKRLKNEAKKEIEKERERAMRGISDEIAQLAVAAAQKAIGSRDSGQLDREIMDAFLKEEGVSDEEDGR